MDSRGCQARLNKLGSISKEQLAIIRQVEHRRFVEATWAKAATKRIEEAIIATNKDVSIAEGSGFRVLASEEEV